MSICYHCLNNPVVDEWEEKAPMPANRYVMETCKFNNHIYAVSGAAPGFIGEETLYRYDFINNQWTTLTSDMIYNGFKQAESTN